MITEELIIKIEKEDGGELQCSVLTTFDIDEKKYIALLPKAEYDENVLLFRYKEVETEEAIEIENIEDDFEFQLAVATFENLMKNETDDDL